MKVTEKNDIMMTVRMLAYNHEKYIAQAIESIVCQKTEYKFELLIADDYSTDGTRDIIRHYQKLYPDIIRVIFHKKNMGGTKNAYSVNLHSRGKYLAGCEGDDFWCDDCRIQKDIDFLESHPEYVGVAHKNRVVDEDGRELSLEEIGEQFAWWKFDKSVYTLKDFEQWKMPAQTSALTIRNIYINADYDFSIMYKGSRYVSDRTAFLLIAMEGNVYCDSEKASCYRYRISGEAGNYMAEYYKQNLRVYNFLLTRRLEYWAKTERGINLDLSYAQKDMLAGAVVTCMRSPTKRNLLVLLDIIRYSGHAIRYFGYIFRIFVRKMYYWHVKKTDQRVIL